MRSFNFSVQRKSLHLQFKQKINVQVEIKKKRENRTVRNTTMTAKAKTGKTKGQKARLRMCGNTRQPRNSFVSLPHR